LNETVEGMLKMLRRMMRGVTINDGITV